MSRCVHELLGNCKIWWTFIVTSSTGHKWNCKFVWWEPKIYIARLDRNNDRRFVCFRLRYWVVCEMYLKLMTEYHLWNERIFQYCTEFLLVFERKEFLLIIVNSKVKTYFSISKSYFLRFENGRMMTGCKNITTYYNVSLPYSFDIIQC